MDGSRVCGVSNLCLACGLAVVCCDVGLLVRE